MSLNKDINDAISLSPYNSKWPEMALNEMETLSVILSLFKIEIEHIGSTSIPNLDAKPVIDIMIGVESLEDARAVIIPLESFGYNYWRENPFKEHFFFAKGLPSAGGEGRTHHVHVIQRSSDFWLMQILFRDYLRSHPDEAEKYLKLKNELAHKHQYDRDGYTDGKTCFVHSILSKAGFKKSESKEN